MFAFKETVTVSRVYIQREIQSQECMHSKKQSISTVFEFKEAINPIVLTFEEVVNQEKCLFDDNGHARDNGVLTFAFTIKVKILYHPSFVSTYNMEFWTSLVNRLHFPGNYSCHSQSCCWC